MAHTYCMLTARRRGRSKLLEVVRRRRIFTTRMALVFVLAGDEPLSRRPIKEPPNMCMRCFFTAIAVYMHEVWLLPGRNQGSHHHSTRVLQGFNGNFIIASVACCAGVGWVYGPFCWRPSKYGKQPRSTVTDMER